MNQRWKARRRPPVSRPRAPQWALCPSLGSTIARIEPHTATLTRPRAPLSEAAWPSARAARVLTMPSVSPKCRPRFRPCPFVLSSLPMHLPLGLTGLASHVQFFSLCILFAILQQQKAYDLNAKLGLRIITCVTSYEGRCQGRLRNDLGKKRSSSKVNLDFGGGSLAPGRCATCSTPSNMTMASAIRLNVAPIVGARRGAPQKSRNGAHPRSPPRAANHEIFQRFLVPC